MSVVVTQSPVLHLPFGKQCEENGTEHVNSSSDTEDSLPLPDSVLDRKEEAKGEKKCLYKEDAVTRLGEQKYSLMTVLGAKRMPVHRRTVALLQDN